MLSSYSVSHACVGLSLKHDYKLIQMKHVLQHNYISFLRCKVHCVYKQNIAGACALDIAIIMIVHNACS